MSIREYKDEVMSRNINVIIYLETDSVKIGKKKTEHFYIGGHGYTYDLKVPGKKKLARNVPTTTGYMVNEKDQNTVVIPIDIVSLYCTNKSSGTEALVSAVNLILEQFKDEPYFKIGIIHGDNTLPNLVKSNLREVAKKNYFGLDADLFNKFYELLEHYKGERSLWLSPNSGLEGGMGNKLATQQAELAGVITNWSHDKEDVLNIQDYKSFDDPESDFNKIVTGTRWYFTTAQSSTHEQIIEGYNRYYFGKVEPAKKYYGKITPDVTYSALYTKEPIGVLNKIYDYVSKNIRNQNDLLFSGNISYIKSKEITRMLDSFPDIKTEKDMVLPFQIAGAEEPTLVEMINPPALSYQIRESIASLDIALESFVKRDENNKYGYQTFLDITDKIYVKTVNKKGVTKVSLNPEFKQTTAILDVVAKHPKAVSDVTLHLSVGYDTPDRNAFNSVECENVRVWCDYETSNDNGISYRTIVETDKYIYIHTSAGANIRVLNKKELGRQ